MASTEKQRPAYRAESPERRAKRLTRNRAYRESHQEEISRVNARWRAANPTKEASRAWREANPTYTRDYMRGRREGTIGPFTSADGPDWKAKNRGAFLQIKRENTNRRRRELFAEAVAYYGGSCYCCGETILLLLGLDHINGGGNEHRREIKERLAGWAKRNGWPALFRVACHSCNLGAHLNGGTCPHRKRSDEHQEDA